MGTFCFRGLVVTMLAIYLPTNFIIVGSGYEIHFDRNYVGTVFRPCLNYLNDQVEIDDKFGKISTFLSVISSRFTNVIVMDQFENQENIYSGEAAARINKEGGMTRLKLTYFVLNSKYPNGNNTNIWAPFESAIKANDIFPKTVSAIAFDKPGNLIDMERTLADLQSLKVNASLHGLSLGVYLECFRDEKDAAMYGIKAKIVLEADFIICGIAPAKQAAAIGVAAGIQEIGENLVMARAYIRQVNPKADVIGMTQWSSMGVEFWETRTNFAEYWRLAGEWARRNHYSLYLLEAIDNPCIQHRNLGWWMLNSTSKKSAVPVYVEKIAELPRNIQIPDESIFPTMPSNTTVKIVPNCSAVSGLSEFNKSLVGVHFSPLIKHFERGLGFPAKSSYTLENIKTMLQVVSGKFSRVFVLNKFLRYGGYIYNFTYYHGSYPHVLSAEAAAMINRDNGNKTLSVTYNVIPFADNAKRTQAGISLAFEAAEKANKIFPGTMHAISFHVFSYLWMVKLTLDYLRLYREKASSLGLRLGISLDCVWLLEQQSTTHKDIYQQIVNESSFVICWLRPVNDERPPETVANVITADLWGFRESIWKLNPNAETIAHTGWHSDSLDMDGNIQNQKIYWEAVNEWAVANKYKLYFEEAFENPGETGTKSHLGWWRLQSNSRINMMDGYVEKICVSEKKPLIKMVPEDENDPKSPMTFWTTTELICGGVATVMVTSLVFIMLYLWKKPNGLSGKQIRDFMLGSNSEASEHNAPTLNCAMGRAYDKSLEIPKEKLKIDKNAPLGSGQFGLVFKGHVESKDGDVIQVAVKVAKSNCTSAALNGLLCEIKVMSYLGYHKNIVELKGACTTELSRGIVHVATELCALGSLQAFLRRNHGITESGQTNGNIGCGSDENSMELAPMQKVSFSDFVRWSQEITCGMEYLEEKQVVHADLATRNVLLTSNKTAKIADFGLSRRMYNYTEYVKTTKEPLPWRWMAIESLKRMEFSSKSDVWSYGVTLWEIFSMGDTPYPGVSWSEEFIAELVNGLRPKCPSFAQPECYKMMRL